MRIIGSPVFNLLVHNCAWLLCVVGRERFIWLSLPLVVGYTFLLVQNSVLATRALAVPLLIGLSVDTLLSWLGVFQFENNPVLVPLWLMVLWLSFATTFSLSLKFLTSNWKLAVAAGATAMPVNYLVGGRVGAVQFGLDTITVGLVLGLLWGVMFPIIFKILKKTAVSHVGA